MPSWVGWNDATNGVGSGGGSMPLNPCDSVVHYPYYLGHLVSGAVQCTDNCPLLSWPDSAQVCHPCALPGCASCSERHCNSCLILHAKFNGQCVYLFGLFFIAVALLAATVALMTAIRTVGLGGNRNPRVLEQGLLHRKRTKPHDYALPGNPLYDFDTTNVRTFHGVGGVAYSLYFRFLLLLASLAGAAIPLLLLVPSLGDLVSHDDLPRVERLWSVALYVAMVLVWASWVRGQTEAIREDAAAVHMRNYAVVATGFPKSARSPHEVKSYFESVLGFEVEGVSVAYDFAEEHTFVVDRLNHLLEMADVHLGVYASDLAAQERVNESQDGHVLDCILNAGAAFVVFERESDREFCLRRFHEIEAQQTALGRTGARKGNSTGEGVHDTEPDGDDEDVPEGAPRTRNVLFRGKYRIVVSPAPEASSVLWENFRTGARGGKLIQLAIAWLFALVAVVAIGSVVFAPAVLYEVSLRNLSSASVTTAQANLGAAEKGVVSLSVTVLNRVGSALLQQAVNATGFLQQPHQDSVALVVAGSIVMIQLFFFLFVAAGVAQIEHSMLIPELVAGELFQLLWMSMLLGELECVLGPSLDYWRSYHAVRKSRYVSVREAEQLLSASPFPLVTGYVDAIGHLLLFAALVAANPASSYALAGAVLLLLHSLYAYFAQKYRFLRSHRTHSITSPKVDLTAQYWLVLPLLVFSLVPLRAAGSILDVYTVAAAGVVNALLLLGVVRASHGKPPPREWTDIPYVEVAARVPWNYFNTNPVHVLRTVHFPSIVVPPVYPHCPGKEYFQGGMFADYDDAVRLQETLMQLVKNPLKDVGRGSRLVVGLE